MIFHILRYTTSRPVSSRVDICLSSPSLNLTRTLTTRRRDWTGNLINVLYLATLYCWPHCSPLFDKIISETFLFSLKYESLCTQKFVKYHAVTLYLKIADNGAYLDGGFKVIHQVPETVEANFIKQLAYNLYAQKRLVRSVHTPSIRQAFTQSRTHCTEAVEVTTNIEWHSFPSQLSFVCVRLAPHHISPHTQQ